MSKKPKIIQLKNNITKTYINSKINCDILKSKLSKKSLLSDIYNDIKINITMIYSNNTTICLITLNNSDEIYNDQIKIFKGKTSKHQDDTYDKKTGEKIAFNRAIQKLSEYFQNIATYYNQNINYINNRITDICEFNFNKITK